MKLYSLQILRGFAAISVLVTHVFQGTNYKPFGEYFLSGQYGVDIFFVLSGFLIYLTVKENANAIGYAKKRVFRIYPLYVFAFLLYVISDTGKYQLGDEIITYIQNITMLPWNKAIGYNSLVIGVAWSTVFEVFFYFLFFIVVLTKISKRWMLIILPFIFLVSQVIVRSNVFPENTPFISFFLSLGSSIHLMMFLVGCFISEVYSLNKIPRINISLYTVLLFLSIACTGLMMLVRYNFILSFSIVSFMFLVIIQFEHYYLLNSNKWYMKTFIHWGDISYSIYFFHIMTIKILMQHFNVKSTSILLLLTFSTTIFLSSLTYKWIEKPFINLSKKHRQPFNI